jgi:general secretion pathway protein C
LTDPAALQSQLSPGARLSLTVERGAGTVPVALTLEGNP